MFDPNKFVIRKARPLPVMLLLDVSSSMAGIKIDTVNNAVRSMLAEFSKSEDEIIVSIITFGNEVKLICPFTLATKINFVNLNAGGMTPMGCALRMAKDIIEDRDKTPSRAYRPIIILISDGEPNDEWQSPLNKFISEGRSAKCDRMAMAIGVEANTAILNKFLIGTSNKLFEANQAHDIVNFFKKVTMTVTQLSQAKNIGAIKNTIPNTKETFDPTTSYSIDGSTIPVDNQDDDESYF